MYSSKLLVKKNRGEHGDDKLSMQTERSSAEHKLNMAENSTPFLPGKSGNYMLLK